MHQPWIGVAMLALWLIELRAHLRLRARLKTVDGWRERWDRTIKWIGVGGPGVTTFDLQILLAAFLGRFSSSSDPDIRRDGMIIRVVLIASTGLLLWALRWG